MRKIQKMCVVVALGVVPLVAVASAARVTFITPPQTIKQDAVSRPLTVRFEDAEGNKVKAGETVYLTLTSTSATGEFSSNAKTWKNDNTHTVSNNSFTRTFYYKDSRIGSSTITARLKGKVSNLEWVALQDIVVGDEKAPIASKEVKTDPVVSVPELPKAGFFENMWAFLKRLFF